MDSRKIVWKETLVIAIGVGIGTALMLAVFFLLNKLQTDVLLGALVGALAAIGNFFFMAVSAVMAADKAAAQNVSGGKATVRNSFSLRMIVLFVLLFACAKSGYFNPIALVLPLLFVRPALTIGEFFRKKEEDEK